MNFEHHDMRVRCETLRQAFPVEKAVPDRFAALLARIAETDDDAPEAKPDDAPRD